MPSRRPPSPAGSGGKEQSLQRKLADLVARRSYSQAIRLREQALERDAPGEAIRCWRPIVDRPAFDPALALRLYPLLDKGDSDDSQEAERLAPDLPDVTGRRGMLALVAGEATTAIPLLWQSLQGGCRSSHVYELLDEALDSCGQETERRRLEREHGPRFGVTPRPGLEQGGWHRPGWMP
jgi:hypothetical protein